MWAQFVLKAKLIVSFGSLAPMQTFRLLLIVLFTTCAVSAQALTITQSYSVADQNSDWSRAFSFEKFNPGLGDLTAVEVDFSALMHNTASFAYSGSGTGRFFAKFTNDFSLSDWNDETFISSRAASSTRWVQHTNRSRSYDFDIGANTIVGELDLTDYADSFVGVGTVGLSMSVSTLFSITNSGSGISLLNALTASSAQLSVIYTYLPAPAPAPAPDTTSFRLPFAPVADEVFAAPDSPFLPPSAADDGPVLAGAADDSAELPEPSVPALLALGMVLLASTKRKPAVGAAGLLPPSQIKPAC